MGHHRGSLKRGAAQQIEAPLAYADHERGAASVFPLPPTLTRRKLLRVSLDVSVLTYRRGERRRRVVRWLASWSDAFALWDPAMIFNVG